MQHLHSLRVTSDKNQIESVDAKFIKEELLKARKKTWKLFVQIRALLKEGLLELEARELALDVCKSQGITKHWHRPWIRFGPGTALNFNNPVQVDYRLQEGDPVYIDLGPVWPAQTLGLEYEGDVGNTFTFGVPKNPESEMCANMARQLFSEAEQKWVHEKSTGEEIYSFLSKRAEELGYLHATDVRGHRIADFPHHKYSRENLAALDFSPQDSLWVLEVQLLHPSKKYGAFFEDVLGAPRP